MHYTQIKEITENGAIRASAAASLRGRWGRAIGASFIFFLVAVGLHWLIGGAFLIPVIGLIVFAVGRMIFLSISFLSPESYFYNFSREDKPEIGGALSYGFYRTGSFYFASLLTWIIVFCKYLLLIVPGIMASFDYALVSVCLAADPELGARDALRRSRAIMHGHRWQYFRMMFFFALLFLLGSFTFGIAYIWIIPYFRCAKIQFFRAVMPDPDSETDEFAALPPVRNSFTVNHPVGSVVLAGFLELLVALVLFLLYLAGLFLLVWMQSEAGGQ